MTQAQATVPQDARTELRPALVALWICSGTQAGAHIELPSGVWLVGCDDACDIILCDCEARHASLEVLADARGMPCLKVKALDGVVRLAGRQAADQEADQDADRVGGQAEEAEAREALEPENAAPWFLGCVCVVWGEAAAPCPKFSLAQALQGWAGAVGKGDASADNTAAAMPDTAQRDDTLAAAASDVGTASPGHDENNVGTSREPRLGKRLVGAAVAALLLAALAVVVAPVNGGLEQSAAEVRAQLAAMGLNSLQVRVLDKGVEVRGTVPEELDMQRLHEMARGLLCPVYLEVGVQEDVLRAVRRSLGIRGFSPTVSIDGEGAQQRVRVAAYMKDEAFEKAAFAALEAEVKGLPPVERHIVHEEELAPVLEAALQRAGLGRVHGVYLAGSVNFAGDVTLKDASPLLEVRRKVEERLGVPLTGALDSGTILNVAAEAAGAAAPAVSAPQPIAQPVAQAGDPMQGVRVTGVTISPMRFVTTADGLRLFEGATLPSGYTLQDIDTRQLVLRLGDKVVTHSLRGSQ